VLGFVLTDRFQAGPDDEFLPRGLGDPGRTSVDPLSGTSTYRVVAPLGRRLVCVAPWPYCTLTRASTSQ